MVSLRQLFAMAIALAVLLAPAFGRAGEAYASTAAHHDMQMADGGHCTPSKSTSDKAPEKICCVSMCMGVSMTLERQVELRASEGKIAPALSGTASLHLSYLGEIATPPPKFG